MKGRRRTPAETKQVVLQTVEETRERSDWSVERTLSVLGVPRSVYYNWRARTHRLQDRVGTGCGWDRPLEEEIAAVVAYALAHTREGYRRLTWMMVDEDVAYLSPTTVYRILSERDLLSRWKPKAGSVGQKPKPASRPHERWHTDLMSLWVRGRWYFLVTVLDAYSRYLVHWELLWSMRAEEVVSVVNAALEKYPGESPQVVHDRGWQFTGKEFRQLVKRFELENIPTRLAHPQSNGRQERWFRSLRQEGLSEADPQSYQQAVEVIGGWVDYYNRERLHAALHYLTPAEYLGGDPAAKLRARAAKLEQARERRREHNRRQAREVGLGLSLSAQGKLRSQTQEPGPGPHQRTTQDQAPCLVAPRGARVAPQRCPILRRGKANATTNGKVTAS